MSNVNHPAHYNVGKIEVIEAIEDWGLGFHLGNAVKYIARAQHKGRENEDLEKAKWYLARYQERCGESRTVEELRERLERPTGCAVPVLYPEMTEEQRQETIADAVGQALHGKPKKAKTRAKRKR